ncbi:MAG: hypothetical protein RLY16_2916 [Bacteroidota bacterium]
MKNILGVLAVGAMVFLASCKKESETFVTPQISDYAPLAVGKYITYQLDSTVFYTNFGTTTEVFSYQVKHTVDAEVTDNLGRPAFRIIRSIRKNGSAAWVPDNTFMAVATSNSLEFVENNLRFIKLKLPISNSYAWKGNAFIDTYSQFSTLRYLDDWDYVYDSLGTSLTLGNVILNNTVKVDQRNEVIGNPDDPTLYSEINYGAENYALGIGLVYRRFFHIEYQPPTSGPGYKVGYGVTYTMIDHN